MRLKYINKLVLRITCMCGLFFLKNGLFAQSYFSKLLPGWENSSFIETDTSYISVGMNHIISPYRNFIQVNELDKTDLSILSHDIYIDTHTHTQLWSLTGFNALSLSNRIFIAGDHFTGVGNGTLFKLNTKTDSISFFKKDTTYWNSRYFGIKAVENKLLIIGDYDEPNFKSNTFIKLIDTNGILSWTKSYTVFPVRNVHLFPKDIVKTSDGGFLLLCQEEEPMFQQIGRTIKLFRPTLIKIDSAGNEQWRKTLGDYRYNNYATNIIQAEDDTSYFVSWHNQDSILYHFGLSPDRWHTRYNDSTTVHLSKIGETGTTQWIKTFKEPNKNSILSIGIVDCMIKSSDRHIIIGGGGGEDGNYGSALAKFTQQGDMVWCRKNLQLEDTVSYPDSFTIMKVLKETKDKGLVFGGEYRYNISPYSSHAYIIKLDKYGCLQPDCHKQDRWYLDSIANAQNKSNKENNILLYPNPTDEEITLKLPASFSLEIPVAVSVYTTKGSLVSEFQLTDYTTIFNTSQLAKGLYFFKFSSEELGTEVIKVVVN